MKVIAINGSPRKKGNTITLLEQAVKGAESKNATADIIHLYDLQYRGCISCFACKHKSKAGLGHCALNDDLSVVLEKVMDSDILLLGSPVYYSNVTGMMRSFLERLLFMNLTYDDPYRKALEKSISAAFFFTMNLPKEAESYYVPLFENTCKMLEYLGGTPEYLACFDTWQFDDYSKYATAIFDVEHKEKVKRELFPLYCKKAFEMGAHLATQL